MSTATLSDFRQNQAQYAALEARREAREREEYETWLRENALPALEHYLEHPETAHTLDELTAAWGLK